MTTTRVVRHVRASPAEVYRALLDPQAVRRWMVPDGGTFRISLTYDAPGAAGKTAGRTDTFHGRFVRLAPDAEVVQRVEFGTDDPALQGAMTITWRLTAAGDGTDLTGVHEHLPPGVLPRRQRAGLEPLRRQAVPPGGGRLIGRLTARQPSAMSLDVGSRDLATR